MEEFIYSNYILFTHAIILISVIAGYIHKKRHPKQNHLFFYFLIYVLVQSNIGAYPYYFWKYDVLNDFNQMIQGTLIQKNYWWFNIFWHLVAPLFFVYYYRGLSKLKLHRDVLKILGILYLGVTVIFYIIQWKDFFNLTFPFVVINAGVVILFCVCLYFIELLQSNKILKFYKSFNFYLSVGILLFYLIKIPLVFFEIYFKTLDHTYVMLKSYITIFIIVFMYGMITIGYFMDKPKNNELFD